MAAGNFHDGPALIYTRMGVVFRAMQVTETEFGVHAEGEWGTSEYEQHRVFLPWTSVDHVRWL